MLTLILAEAALETLPKTVWNNSSIQNYSKKHKKLPGQILLDRSLHHSAMRKLEHGKKRGRPDITHFVLLEALGSPLNKEGFLKIYVHTRNNYVITVNPSVRLPRNYVRFIGLMEQLFYNKRVPPEGEILLELKQKTLKNLLKDAKIDHVLVFSRTGVPKTMEEAISSQQKRNNVAVIVGGFPHGNFSKTTLQEGNEFICVDSEMLDAWVLTSRVIYEFEKNLSIPAKRIN